MDKPTAPSPIKIDDSKAAQQALNDWQSLSPVAILYFVVGTFKHLFGNVIYLIPVVAINYKNLLAHPYIWLPAVLTVLALLTLFAFISFKVYRYRLTDNNIEIRSGVFSKRHLNLPFTRVQNVKIEQPIYYRLTGHACLQLDTAGSTKSEARLVALKISFAEQLKFQIQNHEQSESIEDAAAHSKDVPKQSLNSQVSQEVELNRRTLSDLIIHGVTSNRVYILLGGLAPFYEKIFSSLHEWLTSLGIDLEVLFNLQTHSWLQVGLYALTLTMLVMLLLVSFSVIGAIISFYGYTLSKQDDKYIRRSGLFTKHEVSMRLSRLQMIVQKQDWLDVILKRINLKFEQNNSFSQNLNSATSNKIIVPSIKPYESQALMNDAFPDNNLTKLIDNDAFEPISQRFIIRNICFVIFPLWAIALSSMLINSKLMLSALLCTLTVCICGLVVLRWKRWGIAKDEYFIYIRKGLVGVDYYCFPTYKLQQSQFKQNILMKKHQLATVKFVLASGSLSIPMISENTAYELVDDGLYQVESCRKSWM